MKQTLDCADRLFELSRFLLVHADGLFRHDVLAGLDGGEGALVERVMRGRDEDGIHIRACSSSSAEAYTAAPPAIAATRAAAAWSGSAQATMRHAAIGRPALPVAMVCARMPP